MKTKAVLFATIILTIVFYSCTKNRLVGQWSEIIQLSKKEFNFKSTGDSALIIAKGKWWGINGVRLDTNPININSSATDPCNFTYIDSNMQIVSNNCDTLFIKMNANNTDSERVLTVDLWAGDYTDGIKITQPKN